MCVINVYFFLLEIMHMVLLVFINRAISEDYNRKLHFQRLSSSSRGIIRDLLHAMCDIRYLASPSACHLQRSHISNLRVI